MGAADCGCDRGRLRRLLDGELDEAGRAEALGHLDACEPCRVAIEGLAAGGPWWGELRRLADPSTGPTAPPETTRLDGTDAPSLDFLEPSRTPGHLGRLGPYEILGLIGRGGMGVVLEAFDPALHRRVAIKVLAPELAANGSARLRFTREARAAASVVHDHVVTIHAVSESRGLPYLVMALVKGQSLQERIDRTGPLETAAILRIGMQAARGLAAAHAQGLVHRDVKPANILLENGVERVKLTDFGLARAVDDASLTQSGVVAGTPQYMAPEQARGEPVDHRADLFSLGSVLYAMCTGRPPFRADSTPAVLRRVSEDAPRAVREVNPEIPKGLAEVVARLLAKGPAARFQTAAEVADRLAAQLAEFQGTAPSPGPRGTDWGSPPAGKGHSRRRVRAGLAAVAVLLVAGLGASEGVGVTRISTYLATVLRIPVEDGTLVVEVADPGVRVEVDGRAVAIRGAGVEEIRLHPGSYKVEATRGGVPVLREVVTVDRGGKRVVKVGLEAGGRARASVVEARPPGERSRPASEKPARGVGSTGGARPRLILPGQGSECSTVAFSPDGSSLAAAYGNGTVVLWSLADGRPERTLEGPFQFVSSLAFSPDGKALVSGTGYWSRREVDGEIDLWDPATGRATHRLKGHKGPVFSVAFAPDGGTVASGGVDGVPRLWDVRGGRPEGEWPAQSDWIFAIAFAPDGGTFAVSGELAVRMIDRATGRVSKVLEGHRGQVEAIAYSPDGRTLATGGRDRLIKLWDPSDGLERATLSGHAGWVTSLAFAPDGATLAAAGLAGGHSKEVRLWDVATGRALATIAGADSHSVAWSPDGRAIATGDISGHVKVWDVADLPGPGWPGKSAR